MQIIIDTHDDCGHPERLRAAAAFLLTLAGDIEYPARLTDHEVPAGTPAPTVTLTPPPPPAPPVPPMSGTNVLPFPSPPVPPPPSAPAAATPGDAGAPMGAAAVPPVPAAPLEYDSAQMPWDARIHQKAKGKKKDGTWKLIKGIDEALVQSVVSELAARKLAAAAPAVGAVPPPPAAVAPPVPLPPPAGAVSVPPVPLAPPAESVSVAGPPPSVPVPPPPAVGAVPPAPPATAGTAFRDVMAKITQATRDNKMTPVQVQHIVQQHGCPNLMSLNSMPHIIPDVSASLDAFLLGV